MQATSQLRTAAYSDVGLKRSDNEDRFYVDADSGVFLVVDGIGGHAAGERAAEIAVDIISARLARRTGARERRIQEAFALASTAIFEEAARDHESRGMSCVATLALVEDDEVTVGHVGDSRLYLLTLGAMKKVTLDHSPVGELEDAGSISEDAAMRHPRRNEVYRDLGSAAHTPDDAGFVDVHSFPLPAASALLLCSDGLTDQVNAAEIQSLVEQHAGEPDTAVRALAQAANDAGGKDNVTVVLVETPEYCTPSSSNVAHSHRASTRRWTWFLLGVFTAALCFLAARPYWEPGITLPRIRFGIVRTPRSWKVGAAGVPTIAVALEQARAGDTIDVDPGDYHEAIHLRSGVAVLSTVPHAARIQVDDVAVVGDHVRGARLDGFDLTGPGRIGILIDDSDLQVTNVRVSRMEEAGVKISGSGKSVIQACEIADNSGPGVVLEGTARPLIEHNLIRHNGHGQRMLPGILITQEAVPSLYANVIDQSGAEQIWAPLSFHPGSLMTDNAVAPELPESRQQLKVVGP